MEAEAWANLMAARARVLPTYGTLPPVARETYRFGVGDDCPKCHGCEDACSRCESTGRLSMRRCDACGCMAEERDLQPDALLAAARGTSICWVCEMCSPCPTCEGWAHEKVEDGQGRCGWCQRKPVALIPERCASARSGAA